MEKHIMLAFVSSVTSDRYFKNPIPYTIQDKPYNAIQTNESAIVHVERMLETQGTSLSKIFLIASTSVKNDKISFETEFGSVTALEFLERRIVKEFPHLDGKFSAQDYSEKGDDPAVLLKENILQTAKIADAVMEFKRENSDDEITVHADMTGGFRHASMLMLSIIQLLKYRGLKIGEILYSDPDLQGKPPMPKSPKVYPVGEIQRMFSLITGADEFVNFGSVKALNDYFGKNPPPAVKPLLEAMNRFSNAIKICRTSVIEEELKNLGQHIKTFREHPDKDLRSELFTKIIDTIERGYGKLISGKASRPDIIRWCMDNDFWQQAMTLCTEWLPEEFVTRKICTPKNSLVIKNAELEGQSFGRNWQQQLIISYQGSTQISEKTIDEAGKEFCKTIRNELRNSSVTRIPELQQFFAEYKTSKIFFSRCREGSFSVPYFSKKFPCLSKGLQMIYDGRKKSDTYKKSLAEFYRSIDYNAIPSFIANLPSEKLFDLFKIDRKTIPTTSSESDAKSENKWKNREDTYREMFEKKIIGSAFEQEVALNFLHDYYNLRQERNQINHANARASKKISDIKPMIDNLLDALEKCPRRDENA